MASESEASDKENLDNHNDEDFDDVSKDRHESEEPTEDPIVHHLSGPPEDHHKDFEAIPEGNHESEEPFAHHLSGPPDLSPDFPHIAETKPVRSALGSAPALVDLEQMQNEGEASMRGSDPDPLFFESEPTHTSRRRKCRDISGLSQCLCGDIAKPNEEGSIQCQKIGCKTVWVSSPFHNWPVM